MVKALLRSLLDLSHPLLAGGTQMDIQEDGLQVCSIAVKLKIEKCRQ